MRTGVSAAPVEKVEVFTYRIPTEQPESDGTLKWDHTTLVLVRITAGGKEGLGYTYAGRAAARVVEGVLSGVVSGMDAMAIPAAWGTMRDAVRNLGLPGECANAISAVDVALWDVKARILGVPLVTLLGSARDAVLAYGSGGFTSYDERQLMAQLGGWAENGFRFVKMKVGRDPESDLARVARARRAIGDGVGLFVDANGAYDRKRALAMAEAFADEGVSWFEEPVSSDDLEGLRLIRDRAPAGMDITAGEYGYTPHYFRKMLEAGAVDVLQPDATRCGGITGFMMAAALTEARSLDVSAHCAPSIHVHACCATRRARHIEYFHDHVRIEHMFFDGAPDARHGVLEPDRTRPGMGLTLKTPDTERFAVDVAA